jgi:translation initiation factor 4G
MLDSRDNSVLKSLKELRKQEEERVKKERAEADARAEAEHRAKEEVERKSREETERAKREEEARLRRIEEEKAAREREERLRLEEAERRARIDGEVKVQQERMRLEVQARSAAKGKSTPIGAIIAVLAVVLVIAGGVIFKIKADHQKQLAAQQEQRDREREVEQRTLFEQQKRFEQLEASLKRQITEAKSDSERATIQKQLDDAVRARSHASSSSGARTASAKEKDKKESAPAVAPVLIKERKKVSDDPLEGLKL